MENAALVICPVEPDWTLPDNTSLIELLRSIQFIAEPFRNDFDFLPGDRFLDLFAFMGCAPDINLEPGNDDQQFCFIRLPYDTGSIEFHAGDHCFAPRCPQCGTAVDAWRNKISSGQKNPGGTAWACESCGHTAAPWDYKWRKSAGFGRCFIEVWNIYPREAMPQQPLLDTLNLHYQVNWHYFYQY